MARRLRPKVDEKLLFCVKKIQQKQELAADKKSPARKLTQRQSEKCLKWCGAHTKVVYWRRSMNASRKWQEMRLLLRSAISRQKKTWWNFSTAGKKKSNIGWYVCFVRSMRWDVCVWEREWVCLCQCCHAEQKQIHSERRRSILDSVKLRHQTYHSVQKQTQNAVVAFWTASNSDTKHTILYRNKLRTQS